MTEHGGNIFAASRIIGIPAEKILDFSASINPLGVPEPVAEIIRENINSLRNYPEPFAEELSRYIAIRYGMDERSIICGNGSTELIYLLARVLAPKKVLVLAPTFSEYERACETMWGTQVAQYTLKNDTNFDITPDDFIAAMEGCGMAFLCNPNNPTGRVLKRDAVLKIAHAAKELRCHLVVDEAFIDFVPEHSLATEVEKNPYLIVLRSLTKFYALAGLRLGFGVFPQSLIERVKKYKEPWSVNTLAQKAGITALQDTSYEQETFSVMRENKSIFESGFRALGIEYVPSAVNFYLLKLKNAETVVRALREKGILVRDCSNFTGLDGSYIRIAVKSSQENTLLLKELANVCGQ